MRHQPNKFRPRKKLSFYCDEDFPKPSLDKLKPFKVKHSVLDFGFQGRDDDFHYRNAFNQRSILLTLDEDYLDNKRFKITETFGVIVIKVGYLAHWKRVDQILEKLMPMLKESSGWSLRSIKICASLEGYVKWSLKDNKIERQEFTW